MIWCLIASPNMKKIKRLHLHKNNDPMPTYIFIIIINFDKLLKTDE